MTLPINQKKGLTLIEILLVIVILSVVSVVSAAPLVSFYRQIVFQGNVENILTAVDEARKSTLSSLNSNQYGVHFETNRIVLFEGATFSEPNPTNDEFLLDARVEITSITFTGGGDDIVFDRITGETGQSGSIVIELVVGSSTAKTITVHPTGLAEVL